MVCPVHVISSVRIGVGFTDSPGDPCLILRQPDEFPEMARVVCADDGSHKGIGSHRNRPRKHTGGCPVRINSLMDAISRRQRSISGHKRQQSSGVIDTHLTRLPHNRSRQRVHRCCDPVDSRRALRPLRFREHQVIVALLGRETARIPHTHNALDDAFEQAEMFRRMMDQVNGRA